MCMSVNVLCRSLVRSRVSLSLALVCVREEHACSSVIAIAIAIAIASNLPRSLSNMGMFDHQTDISLSVCLSLSRARREHNDVISL